MITQERLKEIIVYCSDTGIFTRVSSNNKIGTVDSKGYLVIKV
jgi:hypothetical protein